MRDVRVGIILEISRIIYRRYYIYKDLLIVEAAARKFVKVNKLRDTHNTPNTYLLNNKRLYQHNTINMASGECQTRNVNDNTDDQSDAPPPLDSEDIALLKSYGLGPYTVPIKDIEAEIKKHQQTVKDLIGIKESDTGLSQPSQWDLVGDKQMMQEEAPLQVARCTKIIAGEEGAENGGSAPGAGAAADANPSAQLAGNKYVINVKQIAKFVVGLGEKVAPTDIEEGMRVGVDRAKYSIQIPLPPKIDPTVSLMTVEDKPDVTYEDVGGAKDAMEKLREVLETPLLHPERFVALGIEPPKG